MSLIQNTWRLRTNISCTTDQQAPSKTLCTLHTWKAYCQWSRSHEEKNKKIEFASRMSFAVLRLWSLRTCNVSNHKPSWPLQSVSECGQSPAQRPTKPRDASSGNLENCNAGASLVLIELMRLVLSSLLNHYRIVWFASATWCNESIADSIKPMKSKSIHPTTATPLGQSTCKWTQGLCKETNPSAIKMPRSQSSLVRAPLFFPMWRSEVLELNGRYKCKFCSPVKSTSISFQASVFESKKP